MAGVHSTAEFRRQPPPPPPPFPCQTGQAQPSGHPARHSALCFQTGPLPRRPGPPPGGREQASLTRRKAVAARLAAARTGPGSGVPGSRVGSLVLIIPGLTAQPLVSSPPVPAATCFQSFSPNSGFGATAPLSLLSFLEGPGHCSSAGQGQTPFTLELWAKAGGSRGGWERSSWESWGRSGRHRGPGRGLRGSLLGREGFVRPPCPQARTPACGRCSQRLFHVQISGLFRPQAATILRQAACPCVLGASVCPSCVCPRRGSHLSLGTASEATEAVAGDADSEPSSASPPPLRVPAARPREGRAAWMPAPPAAWGRVGSQQVNVICHPLIYVVRAQSPQPPTPALQNCSFLFLIKK